MSNRRGTNGNGKAQIVVLAVTYVSNEGRTLDVDIVFDPNGRIAGPNAKRTHAQQYVKNELGGGRVIACTQKT